MSRVALAHCTSRTFCSDRYCPKCLRHNVSSCRGRAITIRSSFSVPQGQMALSCERPCAFCFIACTETALIWYSRAFLNSRSTFRLDNFVTCETTLTTEFFSCNGSHKAKCKCQGLMRVKSLCKRSPPKTIRHRLNKSRDEQMASFPNPTIRTRVPQSCQRNVVRQSNTKYTSVQFLPFELLY